MRILKFDVQIYKAEPQHIVEDNYLVSDEYQPALFAHCQDEGIDEASGELACYRSSPEPECELLPNQYVNNCSDYMPKYSIETLENSITLMASERNSASVEFSEISSGKFSGFYIEIEGLELDKCLQEIGLYYNFEYKVMNIQETTVGALLEAEHRMSRRISTSDIRFKPLASVALSSSKYAEKILTVDSARKAELERTCLSLNSKSLNEELARICQAANQPHNNSQSLTHPVQYTLTARACLDAQSMTELLLLQLYSYQRLSQKRFTYLNSNSIITQSETFKRRRIMRHGEETFEESMQTDEYGLVMRAVFELARGGAIVIQNIRTNNEAALIANLIREYNSSVLTILDFTNGTERIKHRIVAELDELLFVELEQEPFHVADARAYLQARSDEEDLKPNRRLYKLLDSKKTIFDIAELQQHFNNWKKEELLSQQFKAYGAYYKTVKDKRKAQSTAFDELMGLVGINAVKQQVDEIVKAIEFDRVHSGARLNSSMLSEAMHMCFYGSPGTAKTTVAKLMARILKEKGALPKGDFVEVSGASLGIGSAWLLQRKFKAAKGGVLFIDEAYAIGSSATITELIALMENNRHDTCVILAGYKAGIQKLLASNAGFKSRVPFHLNFPDYTADELTKIFKLMIKQAGLVVSKKTLRDLTKRFESVTKVPNYGNGRYVRNLIEDAVRAQKSRLISRESEVSTTDDEFITLKLEDFTKIAKTNPQKRQAALSKLHRLVGLKDVKTKVHDILSFIEYGAAFPHAQTNACKHMFLTGSPGTAKTTVARIIAEILHESGILEFGSFIEAGKADIVGTYVGATAPKVKALFQSAKGGVLFIDEAYSLADPNNAFCREAVDTIIAEMENMREHIVVIFASYKDDMGALLKMNAGFKSRVPHHISFSDYTSTELVDIFKIMAKDKGLRYSAGVLSTVHNMCEQASKQKDFGNGRYVRNMLEQAHIQLAKRIMSAKSRASDAKAITLIKSDFNYEMPREAGNLVGFVTAA